jgi:hypothetical protein
MPHLLLGMAAFVLASWWVLARGGADDPAQHQPPPAQRETSSASSCDPCAGCDCACDVGDLCGACDACDIGSCDCIAVPPGAVTHTFEAADRSVQGQVRPRHDRRAAMQTWASLGLLVPLAVMFWWRRRR